MTWEGAFLEQSYPDERRLVFRLPRALVALALSAIALSACQSGGDTALHEPIAECDAYEQTMFSCTGRGVSLAAQVAALKTQAERTDLKTACSLNLERVQRACR